MDEVLFLRSNASWISKLHNREGLRTGIGSKTERLNRGARKSEASGQFWPGGQNGT